MDAPQARQISITKDKSFWFVVERALKEYAHAVPGTLVDGVLVEISEAIETHLADSL